MTEYAALTEETLHGLTEEMTRLLDEHPREARDNRFSAIMCGEMAVMRLLHNGSRKKMTAGELSSKLSMTTSRMAAVLGSLEKKGLLERENDVAHVFESRYDFSRENFKKTDIRQRFHHEQRAEKTTERGKVEIAYIFFIGRHKENRYRSQNDRDNEYRIFLQKL